MSPKRITNAINPWNIQPRITPTRIPAAKLYRTQRPRTQMSWNGWPSIAVSVVRAGAWIPAAEAVHRGIPSVAYQGPDGRPE
ncbi:MAG: hypothetical protein AVDCRST_MAG49-1981 [uncultured Thermomicrobiales bacterium]|uniref:Uncharacterized protein n=1 Tax=uncultured Thermomicrobiales bacterium TaxID=1645740 RepID=A0A6J4UNF6_9BACT|nr:MAG: hypothetical protein AVDCRST_MAG49-1981 [uncultured Thermomicrobiales bacterium]